MAKIIKYEESTGNTTGSHFYTEKVGVQFIEDNNEEYVVFWFCGGAADISGGLRSRFELLKDGDTLEISASEFDYTGDHSTNWKPAFGSHSYTGDGTSHKWGIYFKRVI